MIVIILYLPDGHGNIYIIRYIVIYWIIYVDY